VRVIETSMYLLCLDTSVTFNQKKLILLLISRFVEHWKYNYHKFRLHFLNALFVIKCIAVAQLMKNDDCRCVFTGFYVTHKKDHYAFTLNIIEKYTFKSVIGYNLKVLIVFIDI